MIVTRYIYKENVWKLECTNYPLPRVCLREKVNRTFYVLKIEKHYAPRA